MVRVGTGERTAPGNSQLLLPETKSNFLAENATNVSVHTHKYYPVRKEAGRGSTETQPPSSPPVGSRGSHSVTSTRQTSVERLQKPAPVSGSGHPGQAHHGCIFQKINAGGNPQHDGLRPRGVRSRGFLDAPNLPACTRGSPRPPQQLAIFRRAAPRGGGGRGWGRGAAVSQYRSRRAAGSAAARVRTPAPGPVAARRPGPSVTARPRPRCASVRAPHPAPVRVAQPRGGPAGRPPDPAPAGAHRGPAAAHRTYLDPLAGCAVGRGLGTRRRAAASPRAASVAPHRPPPAEGPPPSPRSSPELLRRRSRLLHFRPTLGVAGKCPRRLPHHLLSSPPSSPEWEPDPPSRACAQTAVGGVPATVARADKIPWSPARGGRELAGRSPVASAPGVTGGLPPSSEDLGVSVGNAPDFPSGRSLSVHTNKY